jgi:hypothetical protein
VPDPGNSAIYVPRLHWFHYHNSGRSSVPPEYAGESAAGHSITLWVFRVPAPAAFDQTWP